MRRNIESTSDPSTRERRGPPCRADGLLSENEAHGSAHRAGSQRLGSERVPVPPVPQGRTPVRTEAPGRSRPGKSSRGKVPELLRGEKKRRLGLEPGDILCRCLTEVHRGRQRALHCSDRLLPVRLTPTTLGQGRGGSGDLCVVFLKACPHGNAFFFPQNTSWSPPRSRVSVPRGPAARPGAGSPPGDARRVPGRQFRFPAETWREQRFKMNPG